MTSTVAHRFFVLGIWLAAFTGAYEATGLGPAYPLIAQELSNSANVAPYVTSFMACGFVSTVLAGSRLSRKNFVSLFVLASVIQSAGLVLCGVAANQWMFIGGRAVQGFGEGAVTVAIFFAFTQFIDQPAARARALASVSVAWLSASVLSPIVFSVLPRGNWRPVFVLLIVLSLASLSLVAAASKNAVRKTSDETIAENPKQKFPVLLLVAAGMLFAFSQMVGQWDSVAVIVSVGTLVFVGVTYLLLSGQLGLSATMSSKMLSILTVRGAVSTLYASAMTFLPVILYSQLNLRVALVAIVSAAGAIGWTLGAFCQTALVRLSAKVQLGTGMALVSVGIAAIAGALAANSGWEAVAASVLVAGVGTGITTNALPSFIADLSTSGMVAHDLSAAESIDTVSTTVIIAVVGATVAPLFIGPSSLTATLLFFGALAAASTATTVGIFTVHSRYQGRVSP